MRFMLMSAAAVLAAGTSHAQSLAITELCDATLFGGQPKWVELTNVGTTTIADLSLFSIGNFNNGSSTLGFVATQLNSVSLAPGASYVFAYESPTNVACDPNALVTCFEFVYGFPADQYSGSFTNGDDAIALFNGIAPAGTAGNDPSLFDVYGEIGCDPNAAGTTCPEWEYTDGYSYRCVPGPSATFTLSDWVFGGPDSLEGTVTCDSACQALTLTNPGNFTACGTSTTSFCTSKTMLFCGAASISASGVSSASTSSGFSLSAAPVRGCRSGLLLYSNQPPVAGISFGGPGDGLLCLTPQGLRRAAPIDSGGTAPSVCDGVFSIDVNAFALGAWTSIGCTPAAGQTNPAGFLGNAGTTVSGQIWGRDSTSTGQVLSDGITWNVGP
jgi:hypothetical protein